MPLHIANLGSSFAAGPGIPPQIDTAARRSGSNYAHLLAERLGAKLTDVSVSGATLLNITHEPQVFSGCTFPPQIDSVPGDADVVLILGGGNDSGYIGGLIMDSLNAYFVFRLISKAYGWVMGPSDTNKPDADELAERYGRTLDAVHHKAPKAHVVVVEYLTVVGPDTKPGLDVPLTPTALSRHEGMADQVRTATVKAVQGREEWCTRVPAAELSLEHGIGSKEPWVIGFGFKCLLMKEVWYHPNAEGMKAVADMIYRRLDDTGLVGKGK